MIVFNIARNLRTQSLVPYVISQDGKRKIILMRLKKTYQQNMLWYIYLIPRFIYLFYNHDHTKYLTWHTNKKIEDLKLRHHVDSPI